MKPYELVVIIDPQLSQKQLEEILGKIEKHLEVGEVKEKDDMGLQKFHYNMKDKKHLNQGFMVSYCVHVDPQAILAIKKELGYMKDIIRFVFFEMKKTQPYYTMDDIKKEVQPIVESDEWVVKKSVSFFETRENNKYFVRKAIPLLIKFTTRFGDIKPRKYTGVSVQQQKKIRKAITRARELGLLPYIK